MCASAGGWSLCPPELYAPRTRCKVHGPAFGHEVDLRFPDSAHAAVSNKATPFNLFVDFMENSRVENTFFPPLPRKSTSVQATPDVSPNLLNMLACTLCWSDRGDIYNRPPNFILQSSQFERVILTADARGTFWHPGILAVKCSTRLSVSVIRGRFRLSDFMSSDQNTSVR